MSKRKIFEVIKLAAYYEKVFSDEQVSMYTEDLEPLTDEETALACKLYRQNGSNTFFPRPIAKLVELIKKPISNEDQAQMIVSSIFQMFKKHKESWADGSYTTVDGEFANYFKGKDFLYKTFDEAVLSEIWPNGLMVVQKFGGWKSICDNIYESPEGVVRAQLHKLATASLNLYERTGSFDLLSHKENSNVLEFKSFIKEIKK